MEKTLNELWKLDIATGEWSELEQYGTRPCARLMTHGMAYICLSVYVRVKQAASLHLINWKRLHCASVSETCAYHASTSNTAAL